MRNFHKSLLSIIAAVGLLASSSVFADDFAGALQNGVNATVYQTSVHMHQSPTWAIQEYVDNNRTGDVRNEGVESSVIAKMMEMIHGWQDALGYPVKL